ncbi:MAG: hypothetical protein WAV23_01065 [Minisyncoccia bacterium]
MSKNTNVETIIPIGFYESGKNHSIFYRTKEQPENIFIIPSKDGSLSNFSKKKELVIFKTGFLEKKLKPENIDNIVSSKEDKNNILTFTYKKGNTKHLYLAFSRKDNLCIVQGPISKIKNRGGLVSNYSHDKNYFVYYGESSIHTTFSKDLKRWRKNEEPVLKPRPGFFDKDSLKFISSKVTDKGILVFYDASIKEGENTKIQIGLAMFSLSNPNKLIWRADEPIFENEIPYEKDFETKGIIFSDSKFSIYWYSEKTGTLCTILDLPFAFRKIKEKIEKIEKHQDNPIISPKIVNNKNWMTEGTFNPAALFLDDKIHILFRAIGNDGISRVGYSCSKDGIHFDELHPEPVFSLKYSHMGDKKLVKRYDPVMYPSGGSWGGCEDPRMVNIDGKIYVTFNAFDTWDNIRVGLITIDSEDFSNNNWDKWSTPKLISARGRNKNWVLFPEKINGKFAILHNLYSTDPNKVVVDYIDNIESIGSEGLDLTSPDPQKMPNNKIAWHNRMRSVGTPPIKTEKGWLVFYHATDRAEPSKYKMGAMLLDLDDPTKIISRLSTPIITPDMWYENEGKPGIVYACGAVVKDDTLFIYYGGGDKFVCVATIPFKKFVDSFKNISELVPFISKVTFS